MSFSSVLFVTDKQESFIQVIEPPMVNDVVFFGKAFFEVKHRVHVCGSHQDKLPFLKRGAKLIDFGSPSFICLVTECNSTGCFDWWQEELQEEYYANQGDYSFGDFCYV